MKKRILFFVLLSIALLLSTPLIPAEQITLVKKTLEEKAENIQTQVSQQPKNIDQISNNQLLKTTNIQDLVKLIKSFTTDKDGSGFFSDEDDNLYLLDLIIIFLLLLLVFKGIPNLAQKISTIISWLANNIFVLLSDMLLLIYNLIVFFGETALALILGIGQLIFKIIEIIGISILATIGGVLALIVAIVVAIGYIIVLTVTLLWSGIETTIGLILDILRLIYEAIFQPNRTIN